MRIGAITSRAALAALLACGAAACGDNELGPGSVLSRDEAESLTAALTAAGPPLGNAAYTLAAALNGAELGSFAGYTAIATQVHVTELRDNGEAITRWIGVIGWNGYDESSETVAEATGVFHTLFASPPFPASFDQDVTDGGLLAFARVESTGTHYYPIASGNFTMTSASFGTPVTCPDFPEPSGGGEVTFCTIAFGTMQGSAEYVVDRFSGTGTATFTLQSAAYDLPAAQLVITVDNTTN